MNDLETIKAVMVAPECRPLYRSEREAISKLVERVEDFDRERDVYGRDWALATRYLHKAHRKDIRVIQAENKRLRDALKAIQHKATIKDWSSVFSIATKALEKDK